MIKSLHKFFALVVFVFCTKTTNAQHTSTINAIFDQSTKTIDVSQTINYTNTSKNILNEIQLLDWANAFSSKNTPLAIRFGEDYRRAFRFSSISERGKTFNLKISNKAKENLTWKRLNTKDDIIKVLLKKPLLPKQIVTLKCSYSVKIPSDQFTGYGYSKNGYNFKHWHLVPARHTTKWESFSHKNLNDFSSDFCNYSISFKLQGAHYYESNLNQESEQIINDSTTLFLKGKHIAETKLFISNQPKFKKIKLGDTEIATDVPSDKISDSLQNESIKRVFSFIKSYYGPLPQKKIIASYIDYKKHPVYGFNQLPNGLRPFKNQFQFEIVLLKQMLHEFNKQNLKINFRTNQWVTDGLQTYLMIKFVEKHYPNSKLIGKLSKIIGIRWFHFAKLPFNYQYYLGAKNMPARFLEQPLKTPKDSLLKFNYNISNPFKAGMGLHYLENYTSEKEVKNAIKEFLVQQKLKYTSDTDFISVLKKNSSKEIDWFTNEFVNSKQKTDVKIDKVKRSKDSIYIRLKNKGTPLPVKISAFNKKGIYKEEWTPTIIDTFTLKYTKNEFNRFIIDKQELLPEYNRRNNYRKTKGIFTKPLKFTLFEDIENPKYHQILLTPSYDFNAYDGLILGTAFNNTTFIRRNFSYNIAPNYGLKSQKLLGSISFRYTHQFNNYGWYLFNAGISASTKSFAEGLLFRRFSPNVSFSFRPKDLRRNLRQSINLRYISVQREESPTIELTTPNYNVFNTRYNYSDPNLERVLAFSLSFEQALKFNKISGVFNFRKLFPNNQQINFRVFAGTFINNKTQKNGDFFSFALDRPSDYLFDFNYLSRSTETGFLGQQFITAEGNFKSRLNTRFANRWMISSTLESSIWNWVHTYADSGVLKNKNNKPVWLYDSGIKLNLVQDYLELYFPLQSSLGFEPSLKNYPQRIRFKVNIGIQTLWRLFTREWY